MGRVWGLGWVVAGCCGDKPCRIGRVNTRWPVGDLWWERHAAQRGHGQKLKGEVGLKKAFLWYHTEGILAMYTDGSFIKQRDEQRWKILRYHYYLFRSYSWGGSKEIVVNSSVGFLVTFCSSSPWIHYIIKGLLLQKKSTQSFNTKLNESLSYSVTKVAFCRERNLTQELKVTQIAPFGTLEFD